MKKMLLTAAAAAFVCGSFGIGSTASAAPTLLYSTSFQTPTFADGALVGQDTFATVSGAGTNNQAVSNAASNGQVNLTTSGEDTRRGVTASTSGSVFLGATFTVTAAQATGDYFIHLGQDATNNFYARVSAKAVTGGYVLSLGTAAASATYGTTVLSFNQSYNILARYDFVTGLANDTGALFLNPTTADGVGETPYVNAVNGGTDATTISSVNLRQGSAGSAPTVIIDAISVSAQAAVPEPTTLAALGMSTLLLRRRRI